MRTITQNLNIAVTSDEEKIINEILVSAILGDDFRANELLESKTAEDLIARGALRVEGLSL